MKFIKNIKDYFLSALYGARMTNAQKLEYDEHYAKALEILNKNEDIAKQEIKRYLSHYLIKARLKFKLHKYEESLHDISTIDNIIMSPMEEYYNKTDIRYLRKYYYLMLQILYHAMNNKEAFEKYYSLFESIDNEFDSDELNPIYKYWMPLPETLGV